MKKIVLMFLTFGITFNYIWSQAPDTAWKEQYAKSYETALLEQRIKLSSTAFMEKNKNIIEQKMEAVKDPGEAGTMAAKLLAQMERDMRSGMDMQEAGARFTQSVRIVTGHRDGNLRLQGVDSVRRRNASSTAGNGKKNSEKMGAVNSLEKSGASEMQNGHSGGRKN